MRRSAPGAAVSSTLKAANEALIAAFKKEPANERAIIAAIDSTIKAYGVKKLADKTGLRRESLYKSFAENGNPTFLRTMKVLTALGFSVKAKFTDG